MPLPSIKMIDVLTDAHDRYTKLLSVLTWPTWLKPWG